MRALIQRAKQARVSVERHIVGEIGRGLLIFVGIAKDDEMKDLEYISKKLINLRIFEDENGKMNLDIIEIKGSILSVPQFTLYADTKKGNRPGFNRSAEPEVANNLWKGFNKMIADYGIEVKEGVFGAHMEVELINDGPVTIWLDSKNSCLKNANNS